MQRQFNNIKVLFFHDSWEQTPKNKGKDIKKHYLIIWKKMSKFKISMKRMLQGLLRQNLGTNIHGEQMWNFPYQVEFLWIWSGVWTCGP